MSDPSENVCIENLRPKTIPEQLIALATVSQVSEFQIKLQITGGIIVLVDQTNISQAYTDQLKIDKAPPLSNLFKKGQQYVCKIIEKRTRKGYDDAQDIIATLNPSDLQEDNIPATLFSIPQVPLQCAIQSIEDHGYRVELGFKGLTGFLHFDETADYCRDNNESKKFLVGQVIRCCTKESMTISTDSRVVQLSMKKSTLKQTAFTKEKCSQNVLTEKCILPGSMGFMTVMKVQKDGLVVNFMDEFAGFVSLYHLRDEWQNPKKDYKVSDQSKCTVLYYNCTTKTFALSLKPKSNYKRTLKHFVANYHIGQVIKSAQVVYLDGLKSVNFKVDHYRALANVRDALDEDVATMTKDELHVALDSAYKDGSEHKCRIKSINYADLILVLSLRKEFLELPFVSVDELNPGDFLEATLKKYVKNGIVVTFGLNLRAIILNTHLHDYISPKSYKRYPIGQTVRCRVLKVDSSKHPSRVYLTNKESLMDPEMTIIDTYDKSFKGETVNAIVAKLKHDGIIVELFNNVKGFIPRRFCSTVAIRSVGDLFEVGQVTSCTVYRVEPHRQSLLLGIIPYEKIMEMKKEKKRLTAEKKEVQKLTQIENKPTNKDQRQTTASRKRKFEQVEEEDEDDDDDDEYTTKHNDDEDDNDDSDSDEDQMEDKRQDDVEQEQVKLKKSRLERSKEAKLREEKIREVENALMDPNRPAQSIPDFERLIIKSPNSADVWIKYSSFFLDNVETEKARAVCKRALETINFRMEKEKLKVRLHLIRIEAKYGGSEKLHEIIEEAAQNYDRLELYRRATKVLITCGELNEAERLYELMVKLGPRLPDVWIDYSMFLMEQRKDLTRARDVFEQASKSLSSKQADLVYAKSRFAHFEFKYGDVERAKTMFENLLSENPKRRDLWKVYEAAIRKFGTRQLDSAEICQQNEQILQRIASLSGK